MGTAGHQNTIVDSPNEAKAVQDNFRNVCLSSDPNKPRAEVTAASPYSLNSEPPELWPANHRASALSDGNDFVAD
eukprot:scaffold346271_cov22-Prasinocladus_malaysianus.AAC.1